MKIVGEPIRAVHEGKSKIVGQIIANQLYLTERNDFHFFIREQGFAISTSIINTLLRRGIKKIIIVYHKKQGGYDKLVSYTETWLRKGTPVHERGYEEQLALPLAEMKLLQESQLTLNESEWKK